MYEFAIPNHLNPYEFQELVKVFLPKDEFRLIEAIETEDITKDMVKQRLYEQLSEITAYRPPWGILTGVRPVKLTGELIRKWGKIQTERILLEHYYVSEEKTELLMEIWEHQQEIIQKSSKEAALYVGIPFCPTRCLYCSFPSNQGNQEDIDRYFKALVREVHYVANALRNRKQGVETIYVGGGTPTTLSPLQLDELLSLLKQEFILDNLRELTVEAGRPDTITVEKLRVMKKWGVHRISINPQTMKTETLQRIGRSHTVEEVREAFQESHSMGFIINTDVIAGLPGETPKDFMNTLHEMQSLKPHNITVHTLAVKRGSSLMEQDEGYHYRQRAIVEEMLDMGSKSLREQGYIPYYLYRQKHMAGSLENVGYTLPGYKGWYNVRIMEERQTIVAVGAGGISKAYYSKEDRLERIPNVSNYEIYIDRLEEMIQRKKKDLFMEELS